jgi:hypothetical protein
MRAITSWVLAGAGLILALASVSALSAGSVDLSGTWTLNLEESDFSLHREGDRDGRPDPYRLLHYVGDGPGEGHFELFPGGALQTLVIAQDEMAVTIDYGDGRSQVFHTDGRTTTLELDRGATIAMVASWHDGAFVVERQLLQGGLMTATYQLSGDGQRLYVTVRIEDDGLPESVESQRVYDSAGDSE